MKKGDKARVLTTANVGRHIRGQAGEVIQVDTKSSPAFICLRLMDHRGLFMPHWLYLADVEAVVDIPVPKIGDKIYINGAAYIDHGEDDYQGGLATVSKVESGISGGNPVYFVGVKEVPGHCLNWDQFLFPEQARLKKEYGRQKARPRPDYNDYS